MLLGWVGWVGGAGGGRRRVLLSGLLLLLVVAGWLLLLLLLPLLVEVRGRVAAFVGLRVVVFPRFCLFLLLERNVSLA